MEWLGVLIATLEELDTKRNSPLNVVVGDLVHYVCANYGMAVVRTLPYPTYEDCDYCCYGNLDEAHRIKDLVNKKIEELTSV